jgi:hypothetical protein
VMGGVNVTAAVLTVRRGGAKVAESGLPFCLLGEASCVANLLAESAGSGVSSSGLAPRTLL